MLSTKANTLETLSHRVTRSQVNRLVHFTYREWQGDPEACRERVTRQLNGIVAVRSSAVDEDTVDASNAGAFHSELGVPSHDADALTAAVDRVFASYLAKGSRHPENQVLVQEQNSDIVASGVCTTRSLDNAPYYVVTYAEGDDTAAVTSGGGSQVVKISRFSVQIPPRFRRLMAAIYEIERIFPERPLDIEFGITASGGILIFQTRALVLPAGRDPQMDGRVKRHLAALQAQVDAIGEAQPGLSGRTTCLADMTDWNPAEMIGDRTTPLAFSLYDFLITGDVWSRARATQGYFDVGPRPLVHLIGNKPYIDIRCCFNSFIPADVPAELRERLVAFYMAKLASDPALQDKVEFEILFTCYDASFQRRAEELLDHGFRPDEIECFRESLLRLTNRLLDMDALKRDLATTRQIDRLIPPIPTDGSVSEMLTAAMQSLRLCKEYGTLPFARLARLGFVSAAILKGFVPDVLSHADYEGFYQTVNTIARDLLVDAEKLTQGNLSAETFLKRYGHLRPGTYDITSLRYDEQELRLAANLPHPETSAELSRAGTQSLWRALRSHGLRGSVVELFGFARAATEAREEAKFHFTKLLSEALRWIALAGERLGLSREALSHLRVQDIEAAIGQDEIEIRERWGAIIDAHRERLELDAQIELPPVLFGAPDLEFVVPFTSRPTFITQKTVTAPVVVLNEEAARGKVTVTGKIAVLERGDPGYDWIFTQQPAGLITKYGGAGSHMAIRCNEFSLPAAIGCGEELYRLAVGGGPLTLDCRAKVVRSARVQL